MKSPFFFFWLGVGFKQLKEAFGSFFSSPLFISYPQPQATIPLPPKQPLSILHQPPNSTISMPMSPLPLSPPISNLQSSCSPCQNPSSSCPLTSKATHIHTCCHITTSSLTVPNCLPLAEITPHRTASPTL